jgi:hypothetical protein
VGHSEGAVKNKFCSLRAETCPCGNSYRKPCEAAAAGWDKYAQKFKSSARERSHEAHHIACVAAVTGKITGNADPTVHNIVWNTTWCVNQADNMIALPMWGHTVSWYVDLEGGDLRQANVGGKFVSTVPAPPFADLAQHNYDHAKYLEEVESKLIRIAARLARAVKQHPDDPASSLAGQLNDVITSYKAKLRTSGTHAKWQLGINDRESDCYEPFSMASNPTPLVFPYKGNEMARKVAALRDAFLKLE